MYVCLLVPSHICASKGCFDLKECTCYSWLEKAKWPSNVLAILEKPKGRSPERKRGQPKSITLGSSLLSNSTRYGLVEWFHHTYKGGQYLMKSTIWWNEERRRRRCLITQQEDDHDPIPNPFQSLPYPLWFQTDGHFTCFETRLMTETFDSNDTIPLAWPHSSLPSWQFVWLFVQTSQVLYLTIYPLDDYLFIVLSRRLLTQQKEWMASYDHNFRTSDSFFRTCQAEPPSDSRRKYSLGWGRRWNARARRLVPKLQDKYWGEARKGLGRLEKNSVM